LPPLVQEHQEQHLVVRLYHHHHQYPIKDENIIGNEHTNVSNQNRNLSDIKTYITRIQGSFWLEHRITENK
jgi:hypothetical protein